MKYGLKDETIRKIRSVFAKHPEVEQAIVYGSRAKGNYKAGSDIDLALRGGHELGMAVPHRIMDEIDDLLLPCTVDVSILRLIEDPQMLDHIGRVGAVFYDKSAKTEEPAAERGV